MVACHTWDTIGAQAAGWEAGLIKRVNNDVLDTAAQPQYVGGDLTAVADQIIVQNDPRLSRGTVMRYKTVEIDGINIFYRESGDLKSPKLLLLHGFPSSSHQYRNLISALADRFYVVSPDYPGFGNSDMPDPAKFSYTFDNTALFMEKFLNRIGFARFGLYVQDYGGPVGFRIVGQHPEWLDWLIIQNTNAYEIGFTPAWDELRSNYWKKRNPESEGAISAFLEPETVKVVLHHGT